MDTAYPPKNPFILDGNLAKVNCTEDRVCTSCDTVVLGPKPKPFELFSNLKSKEGSRLDVMFPLAYHYLISLDP